MPRQHRARSLRQQMALIILLCWLLPMALGAGMVGWYLLSGAGRQSEQAMAEQLQLNLQMGSDRLQSALEASRLPSYDPELRAAWGEYRESGNYAALYRRCHALFTRLYQNDSRFSYAVFSFSEAPRERSITVLNGGSGLLNSLVREQWQQDLDPVLQLAEGLDTQVGFLEREGRVYLVRNLMDPDYQTVGVLALALDLTYYFGDLALLPWASAVSVSLGPKVALPVKGEALVGPGKGVLTGAVAGRDFTLEGAAALDYGVILASIGGINWLLPAMALSLLLLLLFTFRLFRRRISQPIAVLMEGAGHIRGGELGYQIDAGTGSREFEYLTESFNQMSGQLRRQFDSLYQEELARKNAEIKALQAHINPHFLNNTLETINWQARLSGDLAASRMIEALSTVLDAALDRRGAPQVRLAEEMSYVNAYLYIVTQRFGDRLHVCIDLPDTLMNCLVPRLILQPVIENAVEHGIGPEGGGQVALRGYLQGAFLILEIENDGGLSAEDEAHIARLLSPDYDLQNEPSGNIGIANVNQRLRILYGPACGLVIRRGQGSQVIARLTIAAQTAGEMSAAGESARESAPLQ